MSDTAVYQQIETCADIVELLDVPNAGLQAWLQEQVNANNSFRYLLAHALDGVIWGRVDKDGTLHIAQSEYTPPFLDDTVQTVRLFGESAEIYVWRSGSGWNGRVIRPIQAGEDETYTEYITESQILWGDRVVNRANGFSVMTDGVQGLHHAVPLHVPDPTEKQATKEDSTQYKNRPLRLAIRHYLAQEDIARVDSSRLVTVHLNEEK